MKHFFETRYNGQEYNATERRAQAMTRFSKGIYVYTLNINSLSLSPSLCVGVMWLCGCLLPRH